MTVRPLAVLLGLVAGSSSALVGVFLLTGLAVALIVGGVALAAACLVVES